MRDAARLLCLIGLVVAALVYFTRPGSWISRERQDLRRSVKGAWHSTKARWPELSRLTAWADAHRVGLIIGVGVLCCLLLVAVDPLPIGWVGIVLLIAIFGVLAVNLWHPGTDTSLLPTGPSPAFAGAGGATLTPAADGTSSPAPSKVVARPTPEAARADLIALVSQLSNDDVRVLRQLAVALQDRD
jgi:hypothetical protein